MVWDLAALDRYRWAGHSVPLRKHCNRWQAVEAVLGQFSQRYRQFGAEGLAQGRQPDLLGGGLRRCAGGWEGSHIPMARRTDLC